MQLGLHQALSPLLESNSSEVIRFDRQAASCVRLAVSRLAGAAIDTLKKCSPDSTRVIGIGLTKDGEPATLFRLRQSNYESCKEAWRIWDGAIILSRWIHDNSKLFAGRRVLEIGSGCASFLTASKLDCVQMLWARWLDSRAVCERSRPFRLHARGKRTRSSSCSFMHCGRFSKSSKRTLLQTKPYLRSQLAFMSSERALCTFADSFVHQVD